MEILFIRLPNDGIVALNGSVVLAVDYNERQWYPPRSAIEGLKGGLGPEHSETPVTCRELDLRDSNQFLSFLDKHGIDRDEWTYGQVTGAALRGD